jgi:hypothetical protein
LELAGCGTMQRIRKKQLWSISIRNVGSDQGAVTIVGIEEGGECIDCVKVKNFSKRRRRNGKETI